MALNKKGFDWKAIRKDQRAIDKLPNRGLAQVDHGAKSKALEAKSDGLYSDKSMKRFSSSMKDKYKKSGHYHAIYNPKGKKHD